MKRFEPGQITEYFNESKKRFEDTHKGNGLLAAIEQLSQTVGDIKAAGIDVSLEMFGDASELAFSMFDSTSVVVPVSGVLRIGPVHRLVAFMTEENEKPSLKFAMSKFDIRYNGPEAVIKENRIDGKARAHVYNLKTDGDAWLKVGKEIVRFAARNEAVNEHDVAEVFDRGHTLKKPALKAPPKSP